jgi:hypothetical protein
MNTQENVTLLADEYRCLIAAAKGTSAEALIKALAKKADWTPQAAEHLLQLANDYGSFMLRNALALSLALNVEDGELGF